MTPQYSTIRRFDLLCVLKDFAEEFSGEIDSGGADLNVTFSIVGENPEGANQDMLGQEYISGQNIPEQRQLRSTESTLHIPSNHVQTIYDNLAQGYNNYRPQ